MTSQIEDLVAECRGQGRLRLTEDESRSVLRYLGIPVIEGCTAGTLAEALSAAERIGFPVVMKVLSSDILHKSDVGSVKTGLRHAGDVRRAWDEIMDSVGRAAPSARIAGVSLQKHAPDGTQVIMGGLRDPGFGPLVMFGTGGVYTEVFRDVAFRLAPLTGREAGRMVESTLVSVLMSGVRGQKPADTGLVCDLLVRLGRGLATNEWIREIEINPFVLWPGGGGAALDSLVILTSL